MIVVGRHVPVGGASERPIKVIDGLLDPLENEHLFIYTREGSVWVSRGRISQNEPGIITKVRP